jgi:hypothetical protein
MAGFARAGRLVWRTGLPPEIRDSRGFDRHGTGPGVQSIRKPGDFRRTLRDKFPLRRII